MQEKENFIYHFVKIHPSEQIPLHQQPTWELSYVVLGQGQRIIGEESHNFTSSDLVLIPPGMRHVWYFDQNNTDSEGNIINISILIKESLFNGLKTILPCLSERIDQLITITSALSFDNQLNQRISKLMLEMRNMDDLHRSKALLDIIFMILEGLDETQKIGNLIQYDESRERLMQINLFISCHFMQSISTADVAKHLGINKSSFCTFFKKSTGKTFVNYLNDFRLDQAIFLLGDKSRKRTIADICFEVGFQSVPHFNHLFKRKFGCSPGHIQ